MQQLQNISVTDRCQAVDQRDISSADQAAMRVAAALDGYARTHAVHAQAEHESADESTGEFAESIGKVPPLAMEITTGTGKTTALAALAARAEALDIDVLVLTRTLALRDDLCAAIDAGGGEAQKYIARQGREEVRANRALEPWLCYKKTAVEKAGERNQRPAISICRECPHGRIVDYAGGGERASRAADWFRSKNLLIQPYTNKPCGFLFDGLPTVKAARVVVAHQAAFSESLALRAMGDGTRRQRLVVVDESVPLGQLVVARVGDLMQWVESVERLRAASAAYIARYSDMQSMSAECAARAQLIALCEIADQVFRSAAAAIALRALPSAEALAELLLHARKAQQMQSGAARWERVALDASGDELKWSMPLRALSALAASLEAGTARVSAGGITFYEPSPILAWARKRGSVIFLDATLPLAVREIVQVLGGRIEHIVARQNLALSRVIGTSYARGQPGRAGYPAHAAACWRDYRAAAGAASGGAWAQIVHLAHVTHAGAEAYGIDIDAAKAAGRKPAAIAAEIAERFERATGCAMGWWGRHERGHDLWSGRSLRIFGLPLLGLQSQADGEGGEAEAGGGSLAREWALARAAALGAGCDAAGWPAEVGELDQCKGRPPLPIDARVRTWLVDRYAGDLVQAIGRARATRTRHTVRVELWGGIDCAEIDAALARAGVVVEGRWPNEVHNYTRGRPVLGGAEAIEAAIDRLAAQGARVSRRAVRAALREAGRGAKDNTIDAVIAEWRQNTIRTLSISILAPVSTEPESADLRPYPQRRNGAVGPGPEHRPKGHQGVDGDRMDKLGESKSRPRPRPAPAAPARRAAP